MIITIDGPVASGKSTIAQALAHRLQFCYISTGYLYRAISYIALSHYECSLSELEACVLRLPLESLFAKLCYKYQRGDRPLIFYGTDDITPFLKTALIDNVSSRISQIGEIRTHVGLMQRAIACNVICDQGVVVEGRDCGSVVFPAADCKFFVTASIAVRARRRQKDRVYSDAHENLLQIRDALIQRDEQDCNRADSPLVVPRDAYVIDNSELNFEETLQLMLDIIVQKL
jgi:CMP/dCMP kinase